MVENIVSPEADNTKDIQGDAEVIDTACQPDANIEDAVLFENQPTGEENCCTIKRAICCCCCIRFERNNGQIIDINGNQVDENGIQITGNIEEPREVTEEVEIIAEETRNILRMTQCKRLDYFGRHLPRFIRLLEDGTLQRSKTENFSSTTDICIDKSFKVTSFKRSNMFGIRVGFESKSLFSFMCRGSSSYLFESEEERDQWLLLLTQIFEQLFPNTTSIAENAAPVEAACECPEETTSSPAVEVVHSED